MGKKISSPVPPDDDGDRDDEKDNGQSSPGAGDDNPFDPAQLEVPASTSGAENLFDPAFLGLSQDFAAESTVAKVWDIIKVEKPSKSRVFRVHPTHCLKTMLLVLKEDNETYLVHPKMRSALASESLVGA